MRLSVLSALFVATPVAVAAQQGVSTNSIRLEEAVERAVAVAPRVRIAEGGVEASRGARAEAVWSIAGNPTFEFERTRRRSPGSQLYEDGWRLSQEIEIAGQAFLRSRAAGQRVSASEAIVRDAERLTALEARHSYLALHLGERRAALSGAYAELADQLADVARRQLDAGEINILAANTATLEAARARSQAERLASEARAAASELSRVLDFERGALVSTRQLPELPLLPEDPGDFFTLAIRQRPDLRAAVLEVEAAGHALGARRRALVPNLELGVFNGQEEGTDDLLGFSIGVSLPLFQRNQAMVGTARANRTAASAVADDRLRRVRADVETWVARYAGARAAESTFAADLLGASADNTILAVRAFEAGETSIADVVVFRSTALAAEMEYLEVLGRAYGAWFELAAAVNGEPDSLMELLGGA